LKKTLRESVLFFPILVIIAAVAISGIGLPSAFAEGQKESSLTILYTASLNGNLAGCDCKQAPKAGLIKRAFYLRNLTDRSRTILLDAGDILDVRPDTLLGGMIMQLYGDLGYDAVAVGDQEFSNGADWLLKEKETTPLFSNNLSVCPDETRCVFFSLDPLILIREDIRIIILSLLDESVFTLYPENVKNTVKLSPPIETTAAMLEMLPGEDLSQQNQKTEHEIIVVLYHGPIENAELLAEKLPQVDVVIAGHEQRLVEQYSTGGTLIVSPGAEGNGVGILELSILKDRIIDYRGSRREFSYIYDQDDAEAAAMLERYYDTLKAKIKANKK
jgi:2',3'-cyclic-nucleotide 2'-phosphodiesterase / 3'-nucleotidase